MKRTAALAFALLVAAHSAAAQAVCTVDRATGTTIDPQPFVKNAYNVRWSYALNRLSMMEPGPDGYYRISTVAPDGSDLRDLPQVTGKHQGATYWHPSGKYLLFTAEKKEWKSRKLFGSPDYEALPGFGRHDDIWLTTPDGKQHWQLTHEPNTKDEGALLPVFSPDGKKLAWSARQPGGTYELEIADFVEKPQPHLENIKSYLPGGKMYYEPGSFTSDSASLVYTSDQDTHSFWASQIYRLDLATWKSTRLTTGGFYNEHPIVVKTPTGDWVVYMSTKNVKRQPFHFFLGTEWYAMKPDGSGEKRLTTMTVKGSPENPGDLQVAGTVAVSPRGDYMLGDVQDSLTRQTGLVRTVRFTCDAR